MCGPEKQQLQVASVRWMASSLIVRVVAHVSWHGKSKYLFGPFDKWRRVVRDIVYTNLLRTFEIIGTIYINVLGFSSSEMVEFRPNFSEKRAASTRIGGQSGTI